MNLLILLIDMDEMISLSQILFFTTVRDVIMGKTKKIEEVKIFIGFCSHIVVNFGKN